MHVNPRQSRITSHLHWPWYMRNSRGKVNRLIVRSKKIIQIGLRTVLSICLCCPHSVVLPAIGIYGMQSTLLCGLVYFWLLFLPLKHAYPYISLVVSNFFRARVIVALINLMCLSA